MLDWARKGFWHYGVSRQFLGLLDGSSNMRPLVGQYFDMACCCCNPYVIAVVSCPPSEIMPTFSTVANNVIPDDGQIDGAWEKVTSIIDPDTNAVISGRWLVRPIDILTSRSWQFEFSGFVSGITEDTQSCFIGMGYAFKDDGVWVSRERPLWLPSYYEGAGYTRNYSHVVINDVGSSYTGRAANLARDSRKVFYGGFGYGTFDLDY